MQNNRDASQMRVIYDELEKILKQQTSLLQFQNYVEDTTANSGASSFEKLLEQDSTILQEASYLQPLSDPPEMQIEARDDLLRILHTVLAESLRSTSNQTLFLYGPPGTGKTLCARRILQELREYYEKRKKPIHIVYVNAGQTRNPYYTLLAITQQMGVKAPSSGWQFTRLKQEFEKAKEAYPAIITIDEADVILPKEREPLIYYLNRQPGVQLILISNHYTDLAALPPRAKSTLQPFPINFQPYTATEIQLILQARIKHALKPRTLTPQALTRIAQITAHKEDLRYAFNLLHTAALTTQASGRKQIQTNDIEAVAGRFKAEQET